MEEFTEKKMDHREAKLSELVESTCEQLYPTTGFILELNGIVPNIRTQKELEAYSGFNLNPNDGSSIKLAYDPNEDALILNSFRHALNKQGTAHFVIKRTLQPADGIECGLEYIRFIETSNPNYNSNIAEKNTRLTNEIVRNFMGGYGISEIPHPTHESYQLWRANLMSECEEGWKVSEEVELLVDIEEDKTETIRIQNNQTYAENGEISKVKQISRIYTAHNPDNMSVKEKQLQVIQITNPFAEVLSTRQELICRELNPFVIGDPGEVTYRETESIPLDEPSFSSFQVLIKDAAEYLRESK